MIFIPILLIVAPILTGLVIYLFKSQRVNKLVFVTQAVLSVAAIAYFFVHFEGSGFSAPVIELGGWRREIAISLRVDALAMAFIFLTLFVWWAVLIYLFDARKTDYNLLFYLTFLQGVFFGIIQTNDLFNMFVFVELTTIIVTILIAYNKTGKSFRAGLYYLLLNTSGVLLFLIGIIFLYNTFGTINIDVIQAGVGDLQDERAVRFAFTLMMAGISVKAALFPVFTWLPKAHGAAKSPISALLSGLIVKGGVYLFIRITTMFEDASFHIDSFFFVIGVVTAFVGIIFAISQRDLKQMLAYSTVSQVGLIIIGLSSSNALVFTGGVYHIFNHALFKALLFLSAGVIIKVYQTKNVDQLHGVFKALPAMSIFMIIGMLAITGAPMLNGFISKSAIFYGFDTVQYWVLFVSNILTATLFVKMATMFFGKKPVSYPMRKWPENISLGMLAIGCLLLGIFYSPILEGLFGVNMTHINPFNLRAVLDYGITLALAFGVYYVFIRKDYAPVRALRKFTLVFQHANFLFIVYIVILTVVFTLL